MQPVRAVVKNGRLVIDEATDLPEGTAVVLAVLDEGNEEEVSAVADSIRQLPERKDSLAERHAVIAERIARVRAGEAELLSVDEVECSIREDLDVLSSRADR